MYSIFVFIIFDLEGGLLYSYTCLPKVVWGTSSLWRILTRWIAFCIQPPPPVNDTNPYNVFRPREKAHRLHTRRVGGKLGSCFHCTSVLGKCFFLKGMTLLKTSHGFWLTKPLHFSLQMQRRENNVQSFEKLRQVSSFNWF